MELGSLVNEPRALSVPKRGISLSQLLGGVSQAVAQAFKAGMWTMVEVVDTRLRSGHVYIEVTERDAGGCILAKSKAVIWASTAARILPEFERATGATLGPGIKLLVRARSSMPSGCSESFCATGPKRTLPTHCARWLLPHYPFEFEFELAHQALPEWFGPLREVAR